MPATNRDEAQLTPAAADTSSSTSRDYLRSQPPSWASLASLQTALALFAVLVIVRSVVRLGYEWFSPPQPDSHHRPGLLDLQSQTSSSSGLRQPCAPPPQPSWAMDEKSRGRGIKGQQQQTQHQHQHQQHHQPRVAFDEEQQQQSFAVAKKTLAIDPVWKTTSAAALPKPFLARAPPAPPLTPPELSTAVFTLDGRPRSRESFIHQPNPDYTTSDTPPSASQSSSASPSTPRRRSYAKTLPIGIPPRSAADPQATLAHSPSSYPPTSPLLPPPPPGPAGAIGVQGEVLSVLDGEGAGWTRHTRVYGGGVCLACAASGGDHGGFYGATVRPEEMR